jgi:hypothetical protein
MVYGIVAVLSFAGMSIGQYSANPVGRDSSNNHSGSYRVGSLDTDGSLDASYSSYSYLSSVRWRIRVHDRTSGISRQSSVKTVVQTAAAVYHVQPVKQPPPLASTEVYSCKQLEDLWIREGGNRNAAEIAASIAKAESGGRVSAISPTDDYGLWQINSSWDYADPGKYLNAVVNVRAAISISYDGTDWDAWTTYRTGAYYGLC